MHRPATQQHHSSPAGAADPELDAVLLHVLSHCAKAADRIKKNNDRLRAASGGDAPPLDAVPKDQGFTRAKVRGFVGLVSACTASKCAGGL